MNRVTNCINKGPLVPFFYGRGGVGGGGGLGEKCEISKPYNAIFVVLGTKLRTKEGVFYSKKVAFIQSNVTQSIPTSNQQMIKTR